ncbi:hypothetical protein llap_19165 [Limosa lapponica baueri]|uniref:Uncharacterized protein n=1 Tax=Limosa lapponica baueri TaxID=1758121 RepID=A0A2I0T9P0_LIMLA|nr:hypothetical protein llap_19165 [Limosa lapponica baueri]
MDWPEGRDFGALPEKVACAQEAPPYNELSEDERHYALFIDGSCHVVENHSKWKAAVWSPTRQVAEATEGEGRDLLSKLEAQITFDKNKIRVHIPQSNVWEAQIYVLQELLKITEHGGKEVPINSLSEIEDTVTPFVWATEKPGRAKSAKLVKIELKPGAKLWDESHDWSTAIGGYELFRRDGIGKEGVVCEGGALYEKRKWFDCTELQ